MRPTIYSILIMAWVTVAYSSPTYTVMVNMIHWTGGELDCEKEMGFEVGQEPGIVEGNFTTNQCFKMENSNETLVMLPSKENSLTLSTSTAVVINFKTDGVAVASTKMNLSDLKTSQSFNFSMLDDTGITVGHVIGVVILSSETEGPTSIMLDNANTCPKSSDCVAWIIVVSFEALLIAVLLSVVVFRGVMNARREKRETIELLGGRSHPRSQPQTLRSMYKHEINTIDGTLAVDWGHAPRKRPAIPKFGAKSQTSANPSYAQHPDDHQEEVEEFDNVIFHHTPSTLPTRPSPNLVAASKGMQRNIDNMTKSIADMRSAGESVKNSMKRTLEETVKRLSYEENLEGKSGTSPTYDFVVMPDVARGTVMYDSAHSLPDEPMDPFTTPMHFGNEVYVDSVDSLGPPTIDLPPALPIRAAVSSRDLTGYDEVIMMKVPTVGINRRSTLEIRLDGRPPVHRKRSGNREKNENANTYDTVISRE